MFSQFRNKFPLTDENGLNTLIISVALKLPQKQFFWKREKFRKNFL